MNSSKNISYYPNNNVFIQTDSYYELGILNYEKFDSIIYNNNSLPLVVFGRTTNTSGGVANVSKTKTINSYTGNNLDVSLNQTFDPINSVYTDSYKTSYTYSGNNALEDLTQFWNSFDSAWQNSTKITYAFDGNSLSSSTYFFWNSADLDWAEESKTENSFTSYNNIKTIINFQYINSNWKPTNSYYFFYGLYTPNATYTSKLNPFEVYPNPANDFILLSLTHLKGNSQINIFDVLGKNVLNLQLTNVGPQLYVPINNLSKGTYIVSIANNGQTSFSMFIKE